MKKHLIALFLSFICLTAVSQRITLNIHQPEPLQITAPSTEFRLLSGHKIVLGNEIIISGGSGHYEKIWSGPGWTVDSIQNLVTVAPLDTSVYSFKVIDEKGCSVEQLFHVNVISSLQLECTTSQISGYGKNDGRIILKIIGGAPPYHVSWSNGETTEVLNNLLPGDYTVTVTDDMNQNQVKTITITEPAQISTVLNISICQGSSYYFGGIDRTIAGQYQNILKTKNGLDSTIILNLTINPVYTKTIEAQICQGSAYKFAGIDRTTAGQYQNSLKTKNGCDSIIILNLTVNPVYSKTIEAQICQGDTYPFAGIDRTLAGQYQNTLKTKNDCDSIIILNLTVNPVSKKTIWAQICQGSAYKFAGIDRTTAGQYQNILKKINGCDSIIILNLSVNPVYTKTLEAQICQGSTYKFAGIDRTTTGQYQNNLKTINGCDSIIILNLAVMPFLTQTIQANICQGSTYNFAGIDRTTTGQYQNTLKSKSGCDSIIILNLVVHPVYTKTMEAQICQGSTYKFAGIDRTTAGQYQNNLKTKNGCDSTIILNLAVNPVYSKTIQAQICQGSTYKFAGIDRTTAGQYQNYLKTKSGCDSTVILNLSVNSLPNIPVITQDGDILRSTSLNGNQWLKDGAVLPGEDKQSLGITQSGNYKVVVSNSSGCSKESTIYHAIKTDVPIIQTADFACKVFPNPNSGMFTIELESDQSDVLVLELFTSDGKSIIKQTLEHLSGKQKIPFGKANLVEGVYTIRISFGTQIINRKLIVNQ